MVTKQDRLAVIPARAGSKRIPLKNIIEFHGKPMIAWTIESALRSGLFDRVIVSTDSERIAKFAIEYGADVPFLRDVYADDHSPVSLVVIDTLNKLKPKHYKIVVQLMPNCPLRDEVDITNAVEYFEKLNLDYLISMFPFGWQNPWWAYRIIDAHRAVPLFDDHIRNQRSQDLEKLYCPTGAIWIAKVNKLLEANSFYGDGFSAFVMNWKNALDIDDEDDLEMAKLLFQLKHKSSI